MIYTLIGFGNMGCALYDGLAAKNEGRVVEPKAERRALAEERGAKTSPTLTTAMAAGADAVVLAVKPQDIAALKDHREILSSLPIISILAGTSSARVSDVTGSRNVARLMPSLAAAVGAAVVGVSVGDDADAAVVDTARAVAEALGRPFELPERLMPAITGLSGSGIAYVFSFVHAMALGGTKAGIPYGTATEIAFELLRGAYETHRAHGETPMETVARVCSPGGTTIEGIAALADSGFDAAVIKAVTAAASRAAELEGQ